MSNFSQPYSQNVHLIYNGEGYCHVGNPCHRDKCDRCKPQQNHNHGHQCTQIGTNCVFYGKDANVVSQMQCLQIPNGTSLTTILEEIDRALCNVAKPNFNIFNYACYGDLQISTHEQFVEVVATELCYLKGEVIRLGNNYATNDIVKVKFVDQVNPAVCGTTKIPRTEIDIEQLLLTIKNTPNLKDLFCSICPVVTPPVTPPVYVPPPVFVPIPVAPPVTPPVTPPVIVVPPVTPPVTAPVSSCIAIENFSYTVNGQANVNNFNIVTGAQDVSVAINTFSPAAYSVPATFEFVLDFNSTGPLSTQSHVFPNVGVGNHSLAILVTNCGRTIRKDISFSITAPLPVTPPTPPPPVCNCNCISLSSANSSLQALFSVTYCDDSTSNYTIPVGGTAGTVCAKSATALTNGIVGTCATNCCSGGVQAYNLQYCTIEEPVNKQLALTGNVSIGTVIKETSSGICYYVQSIGSKVYPFITDYTVVAGDCDACLPPEPVCQWEDDTFFCEGTTRKVNQIDGCGNTRVQVAQVNSKHCGYFSGHIEFPNATNNSSNNPLYCPLGCWVCAKFVADTDYTPYTMNVVWSAYNISGRNLLQDPYIVDPQNAYCSNTTGGRMDVQFQWQGPNCISCNSNIRVVADVTVNGYTYQFTKDFYSRMIQ